MGVGQLLACHACRRSGPLPRRPGPGAGPDAGNRPRPRGSAALPCRDPCGGQAERGLAVFFSCSADAELTSRIWAAVWLWGCTSAVPGWRERLARRSVGLLGDAAGQRAAAAGERAGQDAQERQAGCCCGCRPARSAGSPSPRRPTTESGAGQPADQPARTAQHGAGRARPAGPAARRPRTTPRIGVDQARVSPGSARSARGRDP
jgi:hypothetical protein